VAKRRIIEARYANSLHVKETSSMVE
jgi:hypothetical protein